jgi:tricorn protease-like protein
MPELKELFTIVTHEVEPAADAWIEQERRQRRTVHTRKAAAIALVAAVIVGIAVFAVVSRPRTGEQPATDTPSPISEVPSALGLDEQDVALVDLEGAPVAAIPGLPADAYALSLSADGTRLAFVTGQDEAGIDQIATIVLGGPAMQVLATDGVAASMPAWSPDGTMIAFEGRVAGGPSDLYVMDADGSNIRRLTNDPSPDIYPQWSPDGSTIAYSSGARPEAPDPQYSPTADVWTIPSGGGTPTRLTTSSGWDGHPSYAPDGSRIAYAGRDGIWLMDADGGHPQRVVEAGGFTPRWSPDGTRIAFTTYDASYRPAVPLGDGGTQPNPLVVVNVADVSTGEYHPVGDVGMATDFNTPVWWSNDLLLIRRVGH